jgi:carbon-monoxide dehydrogenase large subunit
MGEFGIGQPVPRTEDPRLLRGMGRYVDDIEIEGTVHGYVLRSPHAHARVKSIDLTAAMNAPGVLTVLTHEDYEADGLGKLPFMAPPAVGFDPSKVKNPGRVPLAADKVRHVGDGVAFVVAETRDQARDAAELIAIDYEILPAVVDLEPALRPGAPLVWNDIPQNTAFVYELGSEEATDAAFAKADKIVSQRMVINRVHANPMENRGCLAEYDAGRDLTTVYSTTQSAFGGRAQLARGVFHQPEMNFRVIAADVGGSFGTRNASDPEAVLTVWAARRLRRPVKWISDRSEAFVADFHGRDNITEAELALDRDGKFLGLRVKTLANLGGQLSWLGCGPPILHTGGLAGVYTTPAAYVNVTGVFTNKHPTGPYRGAGRPEASYVIERLIDCAAAEIGMDPAELRRRNMIQPDALPFETPLFFNYDSGDFPATFAKALEAGDYDSFAARKEEAKSRGKLRGIGLAYTIERAGPAGMEHAEVRIDATGSVQVLAGTTIQGQGHETMYTQVVCDILGVTPDDVDVIFGDTSRVQFGFGTGGSRVSALGSSAAKGAAEKVVEKARKIAAHALEAAEGDLEFSDGSFTVTGTDKSIGIKEIAQIAYIPTKLPPGIEAGLFDKYTYTAKAPNYPNGCHVCEVEIDPDTGVTKVVNYLVIDDVGTVINPLLLEGQIQGGVVQGLGQILMEDVAYDNETGQLLAGSFLDYTMPRADDLCMIHVGSNPVPTATNPLGVKGAGEAGTIGAMPAVMNAVVSALSPLGIRHIDMPATPERVWNVIQQAGGH